MGSQARPTSWPPPPPWTYRTGWEDEETEGEDEDEDVSEEDDEAEGEDADEDVSEEDDQGDEGDWEEDDEAEPGEGYTMTQLKERKFQKAWAGWVYGVGIHFEALNLPSFHDFITILGKLSGSEFPSIESLRTTLLDEAYDEYLASISSMITRAKASKYPRPISLVTDAWVRKDNTVINFMVVDATHREQFFYTSLNTEVATSEALFELMSSVIDDLHKRYTDSEGELKLSSIVVDNASAMQKCGEKLEEKYSELWSIPCQRHAMRLVLGSWCKLLFIKRYVELAIGIVSFILKNGRTSELFEANATSTGYTKELLWPSSRLGKNYLILKQLHEVRNIVVQVFQDAQYKAWVAEQRDTLQEQAKSYEDAISDPQFWSKIDSIQNLFKPVFLVIRLLDRTWPSVGYVWQAWETLKVRTKDASGFSGRQKLVLEHIVLAAEKNFKSCDLFGAAHFLNPVMRSKFDADCRKQVLKVGKKFYPKREDYRKFIEGLRDYELRRGFFQEGGPADLELSEAVVTTDAYGMWTCLGGLVGEDAETSCKALWRVASTVLGMSASNSGSDGNHTAMKNMRWVKRNRLTKDRVAKLAHIYQNSRVSARMKGDGDRDIVSKAARELFCSDQGTSGDDMSSDEEDDDEDVVCLLPRVRDEIPVQHEIWDDSDFEGDDLERSRKYKTSARGEER